MLAGDDAPRAGAAVGFLVEFEESAGGGVEFEDDDPARVGTDDDKVCSATTVSLSAGE